MKDSISLSQLTFITSLAYISHFSGCYVD